LSYELDAGPPPELRFHRPIRPVASVRELWRAGPLILILAERELRVRYKQAVLGVAWGVMTPLALMVVFTLFFQRVAKVDTNGAPYALFAYLGLLPWTFFSASVLHGGLSLADNVELLNKVYFPREVFPLGSLVVAGVDTVMSLLGLAVLFAITGFVPRAASIWVAPILLVQLAFTAGATMVASAVIVYLRDLKHALPIVLQLGLFATPVAYGFEVVPDRLSLVYSAVNPLGPVIDGYRRAVLFGRPPEWGPFAVAGISATLVLVLGYLAFKRMETGLADVA
jgi:ABC-type polysaccharide/polyol phosphate export permease